MPQSHLNILIMSVNTDIHNLIQIRSDVVAILPAVKLEVSKYLRKSPKQIKNNSCVYFIFLFPDVSQHRPGNEDIDTIILGSQTQTE